MVDISFVKCKRGMRLLSVTSDRHWKLNKKIDLLKNCVFDDFFLNFVQNLILRAYANLKNKKQCMFRYLRYLIEMLRF